MYTATAVAKYVINRCNVRNSPITNLKLQKILYYIQGYFFKHLGEAAFDDNIESWRYGPVVPSVYYEYCSYVSNEIQANYDLDDDVQKISNIETKNPVFTVLKRQRCRNAQEVNDISTPFYTPFRPVVRYSNYQGCFLRLNPGWGQETNIDPDN